MKSEGDLLHEGLAVKFSVRLPRRNSSIKVQNQARFLRQLGLNWTTLAQGTGEQKGTWISLNSRRGFDLREWAGEVLEMLDYVGWEREREWELEQK